MKNGRIVLLGILAILMLTGCNNTKVQNQNIKKSDVKVEKTNEVASPKQVDLSQIGNIFGFADDSGKMIIAVPDESENKFESPEKYNIAIGNNGDIIKINFVRFQKANDKDNDRQTAQNFSNMQGYIYEVISGKAVPDKTYLIAKDTTMPRSAFIGLKSTKNVNSTDNYYKKVDKDIINKVELIKNRKIVENDLIAETEDNAKICLFVFERKKDDMLASLAYIKDDKVIFKDYPAKYDETSTWRVDAGDQPGLFEVMFLANSSEGLLLGINWAAPEGESSFILKEKNGAFQETKIIGARYWSPL